MLERGVNAAFAGADIPIEMNERGLRLLEAHLRSFDPCEPACGSDRTCAISLIGSGIFFSNSPMPKMHEPITIRI